MLIDLGFIIPKKKICCANRAKPSFDMSNLKRSERLKAKAEKCFT